MSSMYDLFEMDDQLEQNGVPIDYGDFRIILARAGGANEKYTRNLDQRTKPYQRAIVNNMLPAKQVDEILKATFADTVIKDWQVKDEKGEWVSGIPQKNGPPLPFNRDNVVRVLTELPELWSDIRQQAERAALFRKHVLEVEAGN